MQTKEMTMTKQKQYEETPGFSKEMSNVACEARDAIIKRLTTLERAMMLRWATNEYTNGDPEADAWGFSMAGTKQDAGVISSLCSKGLMKSWQYDKRDTVIALTDAGKMVYAALINAAQQKLEK
jgi:hypothetical protein